MNYNSFSTIKTKNLIIGCDFAAFHSYLRNCTQENVVGFVYSIPINPPPIKYFKGPSTDMIQIYPLDELEDVIRDEKVQKCEIQIRGIPMSDLQSIINRIVSTGVCSIEFFPPKKYSFSSCKPVIAITSLAPKIGKSQLARYFCSVLRNLKTKVSVIIPVIEIKPYDGVFTVKQGPHLEFKENDPIPPNMLDAEDEILIRNYQKSGANRIYLTSNYEKAIIIAEQHSDIIIFDAKGCEYPTISVSAHSAFPPKNDDKSNEKKIEKRRFEKFCVINEETLLDINNKSLWPGILNLYFASNVVLISSSDSEPNQEKYRQLLEGKTVYYANSHLIGQDDSIESTSTENDNDSMSIDNSNNDYSINDNSNNNNNNIDTNENENENKNQGKNETNVEYIIIPKPNETDDTIFYDSNEITDIDLNLFQYLVRYSPEEYTPPLKNHFEAQVDILSVISAASQHELNNNNDSANRETFCRLFLESHLPPNYRVTSGEIIDSFSNRTGQLDVILTTEDCPAMTLNMNSNVIAPILADDVLGVIEVKTNLSRDSLRKALTQLRPVKALMPIHRTLKKADGTIIDDPLEGKIVTGIFSFDASKDIKQFEGILSEYEGVADFVVVPGNTSLFSVQTLKVCGISINDSLVDKGYVKYMTKGSGLALMFGILNTLAATRGFSGSNAIRYLGGFWGGIEEKILQYKNEAVKLLQTVLSNLIHNGRSKKENQAELACFREIANMIYWILKEKTSQNDDENIIELRNSRNQSQNAIDSNPASEEFIDNDNDNDNDN